MPGLLLLLLCLLNPAPESRDKSLARAKQGPRDPQQVKKAVQRQVNQRQEYAIRNSKSKTRISTSDLAELAVAVSDAASSLSPNARPIAKSFMDPFTFHPVRNSLSGSGAPTATADTFVELDNNWQQTTLVAYFPPPGQNFVAIFRDFLRAFVFSNPNTNTVSWGYDWYFQGVANAPAAMPDPSTSITIIAGAKNFQLPICYAVCNTATFQPYGKIQPMGVASGDLDMFWLDSCNIVLTAQSNVATNDAVFELLFTADGSVPVVLSLATVAVGTKTVTVTTSQPGYYALRFRDGDSAMASNTWSVAVAGNHAVYEQHTFPEWEKFSDIISDMSIAGSSMLWKNFTPEQFIGGDIITANGDPGVFWLTYAIGGFTTVQKVESQKLLDGKTGTYAYCKLLRESDLSFQGGITLNDNGLVRARYPIVTNKPWVMSVFKGAANLNGDQTSNVSTAVLTISGEYTTPSKFPERHAPSVNPKAFQDALNIMKVAPNIFTNEFHLSDIGKFLGNVAQKGLGLAIGHLGPAIADNLTGRKRGSLGTLFKDAAPGLLADIGSAIV